MYCGRLFEYRDFGSLTLKGFAENVSAWQVLGASAVESRFEALRDLFYSGVSEPELFEEPDPGSRRFRGGGCGREHPAASIGFAGKTVPMPGSDVDCFSPTSVQAFKSANA